MHYNDAWKCKTLTWRKRGNLLDRYVNNINSVNDKISISEEEKTSITMSIATLDGGTTESHGETRQQHLHLQLHSGRLRNGKRVGAHGYPHHLRNVGDFGFLERIPRSDGACGQDTHSQNTSAQHSLFTSAERTPRAWLKSHGMQCHLCAPEKSRVIWCRTCLTRWYRSLGAHHLPHSLFLLPRHKNTQHNRCNTVTSKNTQFIMRISKLSQSTSSAIKSRSGVKTCRVAETRARQLPQKQHLLGPMTWKVTRRNVWQDIANLQRKRLNNETKSQHHAWMTINLKKKEWVSRRTVCSLLTNWSEMSVFSSYWETWHFVVCEQACACYNKMDKIFCFKTLILQETLKTQNQHQEEFCAFSEVTRLCQ